MDFVEQPTETALRAWRFGSPQAERLCASILHSEGYRSVDPQSPLGGPDGLKDVLFDLNGWKYVAAVYFPPTQKTFAEVKGKFERDLEGVATNGAAGIAFFTNQALTLSEREELETLARSRSAKVILYHVEAIRAILDSPRGYGMRLEYLRIPMKPEEQLSFVTQFGVGLESALRGQTEVLAELATKVAEIHAALRPGAIFPGGPPSVGLAATIATRRMVEALATPSDKSQLAAKRSFITRHLDLELLSYIHRSMFDDEPTAEFAGELRSVGVWIGEPGSLPDQARYIPPPPEEVPNLLEDLLGEWRDGYEALTSASATERLDAIVTFHHGFLQIHPFLDGNGRIARLLLEQQARELLNVDRKLVLEDSQAYFAALQLAHTGDLTELRRIVTQALFGEWELQE